MAAPDEGKKTGIRQLERAREGMAAARKLVASNHHRDALVVAHQAVWHAAAGLLRWSGRTIVVGEDLGPPMQERFIRTKLMLPEHGRTVARAVAARLKVDDDFASVVVADDVQESLDRAASFVSAVGALLAKAGDG